MQRFSPSRICPLPMQASLPVTLTGFISAKPLSMFMESVPVNTEMNEIIKAPESYHKVSQHRKFS